MLTFNRICKKIPQKDIVERTTVHGSTTLMLSLYAGAMRRVSGGIDEGVRLIRLGLVVLDSRHLKLASRCHTGKRGIAKTEHDAPIPLAWLTSDETAQFRAGRELFELPFSPRDGLGPFFNARSCEACHHIPSIGGSGPGYRGNIRYIVPSGPTTGVLFHDKAVDRGSAERLPENAILSKRRPSTLMGIGLVEAIP